MKNWQLQSTPGRDDLYRLVEIMPDGRRQRPIGILFLTEAKAFNEDAALMVNAPATAAKLAELTNAVKEQFGYDESQGLHSRNDRLNLNVAQATELLEKINREASDL